MCGELVCTGACAGVYESIAMDVPKESNTIAASVIFLGGIVIDAFTAVEPYDGSHAATSLRTTAVVLLGCLAAPPIRQWMVFEQRAMLAAALATVSLVGWHEMGQGARVADAVYVSICLGGMLVTFWRGVDELSGVVNEKASRPKAKSPSAPPYTHREMLVNTAVATLFYSSFRLLRAALRSPEVARTFEVGTLPYDGVRTVRLEPTLLFPSMHFEPIRTLSNTACTHEHPLPRIAHFGYEGDLLASSTHTPTYTYTRTRMLP